MVRCLCTGRTDIYCGPDRCDLAGVGAPGDANQCRICWLRLGSPVHGEEPRGDVALLPCRHLGVGTGKTVACPSCRGKVELKLFACAIHGQCTQGPKEAAGIASCGRCPDRQPADAGQMVVTADGIGDHLQALAVGMAWKQANPGKELLLVAKGGAIPWLSLFDCRVVREETPGVPLVHDVRERGDLHYVETCAKVPRAVPKLLPLDQAAVAWAEQYRGSVVLSPWTAYHRPGAPGWVPNHRVWLRSHWLALERLLAKASQRVVVIDTDAGRNDAFASPVLLREHPHRVAALMLAARAVVGNDAGMAHLAGALGSPCVVLAGPSNATAIFANWPKTKVIMGPLDCSGCRWRGPNYRNHCATLCASLQAIQPEDVVRAIEEVAPRKLSQLAGLVPLRQITAEIVAEQERHLREDVALYQVGQSRGLGALLGALREEVASSRPDLVPLVLEATWMSRRMGDGAGQQIPWHLYAPADGPSLQPVPFVVPPGIGDSVWALTKIQALAQGEPIDLVVAGNPNDEIGSRALPFLRRFKFLRSVEMRRLSTLQPGKATDEKGRYRYVADGRRGGLHYLMPNAALERGERLETWLPGVPINWNVMEEFDYSGAEMGDHNGKLLGHFVAFYLGPEAGNTVAGHNRGHLWRPEQWVALGRAMRDRGLTVAVVGAPYDTSYWHKYVKPLVERDGQEWRDFIGAFEIGSTFAFLHWARALISYQCGLGIVGNYLGIATVMFWRPNGDSAESGRLVSFHEDMRHCWTRPDTPNSYLGLVYGRQSAADVVAEIDRRGWLS